MDEDQQRALNEEAEEINSRAASPTEEPKAPEAEPTEDAEVATEAPEEGTDTGEESKKGYSNRVRELNQRAKSAEEKAASLEAKIAALTGSGSAEPKTDYYPTGGNQFNPQEPIVAPGEEIDVNELNRRIMAREQRLLQTSNANTELKFKQMEAISRINSETNAAIREHPELDPDSEFFNKDLSDAIVEATEAYVTKNPYDASVKKFVSKLMKPYKGAIDKEVGQASENIAKQVSQAALRPTNIRKPEKTADEKSIAELEQELGIVHS